MLIVCPSCASEYAIDPALIGAGRKVRCASCRATWMVAPPAEAAVPAAPVPEDAGAPAAAPAPAVAAEEAGQAAAVESAQPYAEAESEIEGGWAAAGPAAAATIIEDRPAKPRPDKAVRRRHLRAVTAAALAGCIALAGALFLAREPILAWGPAAAPLYAALGLGEGGGGLALRGITAERLLDGADTVLVVEGEISNLTRRALTVPSLDIAVQGEGGTPLSSSQTKPPRATLGPGETTRFSARMPSPPAQGRQVLVLFSTLRGKAAAIGPAAPQHGLR